MDLMNQMHLRAFIFVTDCFENEMKTSCPNDLETRIRIIDEIMRDSVCERFKGHISVEKLNPLYKKYYELICEKNPKEILNFSCISPSVRFMLSVLIVWSVLT